jgi:hypothetical protein
VPYNLPAVVASSAVATAVGAPSYIVGNIKNRFDAAAAAWSRM